jgi:hypothetical protein
MKKALVLLVLALALPSAALAKGKPSPNNGSNTTHGKAKVMYVLRGTLSAYTAYASNTPGSITITVSRSNRHGKLLKGLQVTVMVGAKTKILLKHGVSAINDGDLGTVKVRAARFAFKDPNATSANIQAALATATAFQIVDRGPAPTS